MQRLIDSELYPGEGSALEVDSGDNEIERKR